MSPLYISVRGTALACGRECESQRRGLLPRVRQGVGEGDALRRLRHVRLGLSKVRSHGAGQASRLRRGQRACVLVVVPGLQGRICSSVCWEDCEAEEGGAGGVGVHAA